MRILKKSRETETSLIWVVQDQAQFFQKEIVYVILYLFNFLILNRDRVGVTAFTISTFSFYSLKDKVNSNLVLCSVLIYQLYAS